ncbi:MAG TPA: dihydrofolate reductase family protein [Myxococcaceae bacterium]|nr:dihydrofolate reductase family protein [Myxococcaceae bacterium]
MDRPKVSAFLGTSLDGFIAEPDGGFAFLKPFEQEDNGYRGFYATVDTLLMGRRTYETVLGFDAWPFADKRVAVLSRSQRTPRFNERFLSGEPRTVLAALAALGARHVYADGGEVVTQLLAARCLDALVVTVVPVVLGEGIRLFATSPGTHRLTLESSRTFASGMVQLRYRL